jgi:hypothetical protein
MITKAQLIKKIDSILPTFADDDYSRQYKLSLIEVRRALSFDISYCMREMPVRVAVKRIEFCVHMLTA